MTSHQPAPRGIDHLVLCVDDLSQAADLYEKLGFTVTPTGRHDFGTGNRLVQLHGCFLELLTVMDTARVPADRAGEFNFAGFNRDYLLARQGMSMLVFESAAVKAA